MGTFVEEGVAGRPGVLVDGLGVSGRASAVRTRAFTRDGVLGDRSAGAGCEVTEFKALVVLTDELPALLVSVSAGMLVDWKDRALRWGNVTPVLGVDPDLALVVLVSLKALLAAVWMESAGVGELTGDFSRAGNKTET